MDAHTIVKGYILGSMFFNVLFTIAMVGRERDVITPGVATFLVAITAAHAAIYAKYL